MKLVAKTPTALTKVRITHPGIYMCVCIYLQDMFLD